MVYKTRDITETQVRDVDLDEPVAPNGTPPTLNRSPSTHPDPVRERHLDALLEKAWPRIKASMYYLRDR